MANSITQRENHTSKKILPPKNLDVSKKFSLLFSKKLMMEKKIPNAVKISKNKVYQDKKFSIKPEDNFAQKNTPENLLSPSKIVITENSPVNENNTRINSSDASSICLAKIEELHALVKKLTLNFNLKKTESTFYIQEGIFGGAKFTVLSKDKNIDIVVNHASTDASALLSRHRNLLSKNLSEKEIKLQSLLFK